MRFFFSSDRHIDAPPTTDNAFPAELVDEGGGHAEVQHARLFVWNGAAWAKMSQPGGAGGGDGAILDGVSATIKATVFDYANSNPLAVTLVDATGAQYNATGGGGGGGAVTIADGADVAQGTTTDASSANTVVGILKAIKAAITGTLATSRTWVLSSGTDSVNVGNFPATQPVSGTVDVSDRVARLLGHVTVDNASIPVTGTFWQATQPVSEASLDASIIAQGSAVPANVVVAGMRNSAGNADRLQGVSDNANTFAASGGGNSLRSAALNFLWDGTNWQRLQGTAAGLLKVDASGVTVPVTNSEQRAATLVGTTISAANAGVTLTLAAAGAGLFHYITSIEIVVTNPTVTNIAAAATNLAWTSTNLGGMAWNAGTTLTAGTEKLITRTSFPQALKSAVANTATTIVAPACGAGTLCRIQVTYYTGV